MGSSPVAWRVLKYMQENPGVALNRDQIAQATQLTPDQVRDAVRNARLTNPAVHDSVEVLARGSMWRFTDDGHNGTKIPSAPDTSFDVAAVPAPVAQPAARRPGKSISSALDVGAMLEVIGRGEAGTVLARAEDGTLHTVRPWNGR